MAIWPEAKGAIFEKAEQLYNSRLEDKISKSDVRQMQNKLATLRAIGYSHIRCGVINKPTGHTEHVLLQIFLGMLQVR